jgi:hypothetical protein
MKTVAISLLISILVMSAPVVAAKRPILIAQKSIAEYEKNDEDGKIGRAEFLNSNISKINKDSSLSIPKKARLIYKVRREVIENLNKRISFGLYGTYMKIEDKNTIVRRWTVERDTLQELADREIYPFLTAKEKQMMQILKEQRAKLKNK